MFRNLEFDAVTSMVGARNSRHIVWDWNGTLLDDNHAVVSAVNAVCAAFGREHIGLEQWRAVFSRPLVQCYERLLDRSINAEDWAQIDLLYHNAYRELLYTSTLAEGVPHLLREWGRIGTQSLLSMWFHDELVPLVTEFELHSLFERIDGLRDEVGGGSKAGHLDEHLRVLEIDPTEAVLIGDVVDDARAAEQVGTSCILLTTGVMSRHALEATGFPVVESISEAVEKVGAGGAT